MNGEQTADQVEDYYLNSTTLLFQDVYKFPIISRRCQEKWLGIQINAVDWIDRLDEEEGLEFTVSNAPSRLIQTAYKSSLEYFLKLEAYCSDEKLQPPKLEVWIAELLFVRQNVFELHRSKFRRFIRVLNKVSDEFERNELKNYAYNVVELLCLCSSSALNHIVEFERIFERLPSSDELAEWLEKAIISKHFLQAIRSQSQTAREILVTGYLRYVLRMARNYLGQGVVYSDLVQEGFIGLIKAAERYNHREHPSFAQYATSWIWQRVGRAVDKQSRTIRLPVHLQAEIHKLEAAYQACIDSGKFLPSAKDLLLRLDFFSQEEKEILQGLESMDDSASECIPKHCQKKLERVKRYVKYAQPTIPLALTIPDRIINRVSTLMRDYPSGKANLSELIPDWDNPALEAVADLAIAKGRIDQALEKLLPRERQIIIWRFGLQNGKEWTLKEIGQEFGLTRERIRQIEETAIGTLKLTIVLLSTEMEISETPLVYLPREVVAYLDEEFNHWQFHTEDCTQNWDWIDQLIEQLPGGDWHHGRLGNGLTRQDQLEAALYELSAPAHCSEITEQLNTSLSKEELDEKYVYTLLMKYEQTFVLLGQGVFSLLKWEQDRADHVEPVLPFCPSPLPDPSNQRDAFFESVLIAQNVLKRGLRAKQFLNEMFDWAGVQDTQSQWFKQSILSAYYLVGLIPYTFFFEDNNPILKCTLPEINLQELRCYCLQRLTERLMAMPEFWWTFQRYQPARPSRLGEQFIEMHPLGLDDVINRLNILTSLGASQRLNYGQYRLTLLGEELANQWKQRPTFIHGAETIQNKQIENDLESIDLAVW